MQYNLSKREIDLISECIHCKINYYEGLLLMLDFQTEEQKWRKYYLDEALKELRLLQAKTSYIGQDPKFQIDCVENK